MRSVNNSVDTINAAAAAIVSAESRVQPTAVQKRRWGGCWSLYWCFGSHKTSKRIGHAVLVPEPEVSGAFIAASENQTHSNSVAVPFIAPPSSPASFLQSDPPSASHSPAGLLSLTSFSVNSYSPGGPASIFAIGPYAHETQLVTPPVFSAFTTEPSTASFTPPPESVQMTTPSSPEVPFAQLLTSSLERARRNSASNQKFTLSHYEIQSYPLYPGSPGSQLISPGSVISNSGTSSPFPDRHPITEFCVGEAPKLLGFEHFTTCKWGPRLGSGSLTAGVVGLGSRFGSGSVTPDGAGQGSRLGSGSVTPNGVGLRSRLGSGSVTPDCSGAASRVGFLIENDVAYLAKTENGSKPDETIVDHRVSFELSGEEVARCLESKAITPCRAFSTCPQDNMADDEIKRPKLLTNIENCLPINGPSSETTEEHCYRKHRSATLGSIKDFNFDHKEIPNKLTLSSEWWANETISGKDAKQANSWTFFPLLQPEVS